jgi:hypothetical protein
VREVGRRIDDIALKEQEQEQEQEGGKTKLKHILWGLSISGSPVGGCSEAPPTTTSRIGPICGKEFQGKTSQTNNVKARARK